MTRDDITESELRSRIIFSLMVPIAQVATTLNLPLSDMKKWLETAYFQEARRRGLELKEITQVMDVSISKASLLSRQLKENFLESQQEHELPRRIEYMLWAQPLSEGRLSQVLPGIEADELRDALDLLVREQRIAMKQEAPGLEPKYELQIKKARRVWDNWLARLDGLQNALRTVGDTVYSRFFATDLPAFARTLTFHIRDEDVEALERFYEEEVFPFIENLNNAAEDSGDAKTISLSLFWALKDAVQPDEESP